MISVIVERAPADKQGKDISDPLITSDTVAIERGRNEIDAASTNRELVSGTLPLRGWIAPGLLAEVQDMDAPAWVGMITGCTIALNRTNEELTMECSITMEREAA